MKIDIIIYSKHTAVGVVLITALEFCGIAYIQEFSNKIDNEILKQLENKCRWIIEDSKTAEYLKNNYESGCFLKLDDFNKYICVLYKKFYWSRVHKKELIEHDNNYAELAKYSDTDFIIILQELLFKKEENLKKRITNEDLAKQRINIAKILCERKSIYGFCYLSIYYNIGYGTKKSNKMALDCINKAKEIGFDISDWLSFFDNEIKKNPK